MDMHMLLVTKHFFQSYKELTLSKHSPTYLATDLTENLKCGISLIQTS